MAQDNATCGDASAIYYILGILWSKKFEMAFYMGAFMPFSSIYGVKFIIG